MTAGLSWGRLSAVAAFATFALLSGCAELALQKVAQGASADDVRRAAGRPSEELILPDGSKAWYYVAGPTGWTTYRVHFSASDGVLDSRQVLTPQSFQQDLVSGKTTREQAMAALGPPGLIMSFPNLNEVVWTYRWMDVEMPSKMDVHFDATTGVVRYYNTYWDPCPSASIMCAGT